MILMLAASLLATRPAISQTTTGNQSAGAPPNIVNGEAVIGNIQLNAGDVTADVPLTVTENDGLTSATSQATGNSLLGGNDTVDGNLTNSQTNQKRVYSSSTITGTNGGNEDLSLGTPVYATSQATGNYSGFSAANSHLAASSTQTSTGSDVSAHTAITADNNAIYVSGQADATATVNHTAWQVTHGRLDAQSWQESSSEAHANTSATVHYSPSPNLYSASATNNYYGSYSGAGGSQEHEVHQTQSSLTQSRAELYGGNVWITATQSTAIGNRTDLQNQGGSLVVSNDQTQGGEVLSQAHTEADQYSTANATASAVGNMLAAGDNDVYVRVDNVQLSSGGVDAEASFVGNNGYDSYITAEAYGNQALAYACSECRADFGVNSTQTNNSDVNATSTVTQNGQGRGMVVTARATGNSATYYVSGGHQ